VCRIRAEILDLPAVMPEDIRAVTVVARCRLPGLGATSRGILLAQDVREFVESIRSELPRAI
jgi:hypothetical protein